MGFFPRRCIGGCNQVSCQLPAWTVVHGSQSRAVVDLLLLLSEVILSAVQYTFSFSPLPKLLLGFPTSHMHLIRIFDITLSQQTVLYVPPWYTLFIGEVKWKSLSHVGLFVIPCTVSCQAPLFMEFSRQEYWSGLPWGSSQARDRTQSPTLQVDSLTSEPPGKPKNTGVGSLFLL